MESRYRSKWLRVGALKSVEEEKSRLRPHGNESQS